MTCDFMTVFSCFRLCFSVHACVCTYSICGSNASPSQTTQKPALPECQLDLELSWKAPTIWDSGSRPFQPPSTLYITVIKIMQPDPIGRAPQPAPALKCPTLRVVRALCDQWTARTVRAFELLLRERGSVVCASRSMIWHRRRMMVDWILFGAEE